MMPPRSICRGAAFSLIVLCVALTASCARADDATPSRHQAMKECMQKQKAADSGKTRAEMRAACRDVTKNARQNADAEKKAPPPQTTPPTP